VAPDSADEAVGAAGRALGTSLAPLLAQNAGRGWSLVPGDEALALAALERDPEPRLVTNVDFSDQRVGGLTTGVALRLPGQLALRPGEKELMGGDIAAQTEQVFANLRAILGEAGSSLDRLVKTTVFLQNLDDFAGMNEVYAKHIGDSPPARSTVEVSRLPSGALVEIEAIALV